MDSPSIAFSPARSVRPMIEFVFYAALTSNLHPPCTHDACDPVAVVAHSLLSLPA